MMDKYDQFFTADHVDEQIEHNAREWPTTPESQLLREIQQVAQQIRAEHNSSLQRTWMRLQEKSRPYVISSHHSREENTMQRKEVVSIPPHSAPINQRAARRIRHPLGLTAAAAIVLLTILTWAFFTGMFWQHNHQSTQVGSPGAQNLSLTCSAPDTVAPLLFGVLYNLSWSATDKIAFAYKNALVVNTATCMQDNSFHKNLPGVAAAVWSPNGKYLLVQTSVTSITRTYPLQGKETDTLTILDSSGKVLTSLIINQQQLAAQKQVEGDPFMSSLSGGGPTSSDFLGPVWSPDGSQISEIYSNGSSPQTLKHWSWNASNHQLAPLSNQQKNASTALDLPGTAGIVSAAWSPDGKYIAVGTSTQGTSVVVLDAHTGARIKNLDITSNTPISHIAWSPDGKELVVINRAVAQIVQFSTGKVLHTLANPGGVIEDQTNAPGTLAWSPDGQYIAIGYHQAAIWDAQTGKMVRHINAHSNAMIVALGWSPDSEQLAIQVFVVPPQASQRQAALYIWHL